MAMSSFRLFQSATTAGDAATVDADSSTCASADRTENQHSTAAVVDAATARRHLESVSVQDSDALFAKEFSQLTMKERDQVLYDIHGVADVMQESSAPDFIPNQCALLQTEIQKQLALANRNDANTGHRIANEALQTAASSTEPLSDAQAQFNRDNRTYAYRLAWQIDRSYITSEPFLLFFLRSELFDVSKAAMRLFLYLQAKLDLFGTRCLCRNVLYNDLTDDDRETLRSGYLQLLPGRDRAGRAILMLFPGLRGSRTHNNSNLRAVYYVTMTALEDVTTQQRGMVFIVYNVANHFVDHLAAWKNGRLLNCLPYRLVAFHYCYDNAKIRLLLSLTLFDKHTRTRFRHHFGTPMECIYKLMTFGISNTILPVTADGTMNLQKHRDWCTHRQQLDEAKSGSAASSTRPMSRTSGQAECCEGNLSGLKSSAGHCSDRALGKSTPHPSVSMSVQSTANSTEMFAPNAVYSVAPIDSHPGQPIQSNDENLTARKETAPVKPQQVVDRLQASKTTTSSHFESQQCKPGTRVVVPGQNDVLLGRGRPFQEHPGNLRYSHLIETNRPKYDTSKKLQKTALTKDIMRQVQESGGRFLKQDGASWIVVTDAVARDKISHGFRNRRAVVTAQAKREEQRKQYRSQRHAPSHERSLCAVNRPSQQLKLGDGANVASGISTTSASTSRTSTSLSGSKRLPSTVHVDMDAYLQAFSEEDQEANQVKAHTFFAGLQQFFGDSFGGGMIPQQQHSVPFQATLEQDMQQNSSTKRLRKESSTSMSDVLANVDGGRSVEASNGGLDSIEISSDLGVGVNDVDQQSKVSVPGMYPLHAGLIGGVPNGQRDGVYRNGSFSTQFPM